MPIELLERFFHACIRWLYARRLPENCLAWTQVCARWRCVALGSARLWQYIDLAHARFAQEFLTRSKFAPVFIMTHAPEKRFAGSLHLHAYRICSIDVVLHSNDMQHLLEDVACDLPNLSVLSLALQPGSHNTRCHIRINHVRRLALNGIAVSWDDCSNLTQLSLRGLGETFAPSLWQLCSILDQSPELESLRIENSAITVPFWAMMPGHSIIRLPSLRELVLFSQAPQFIHYLLTQFHIPPPAKLQLTCPSYSQLPELGRIFTESDKIVDTETRVAALRLRRWSVQLLRCASAPWSENYTDISASITFLSPWQTPQIHNFRHLIDVSRLKTLELDAVILDDIPTDAMQRLFTAMPCLHTLRVALNELAVLLAILDPATTGGLLCPHLRVLSFSRSNDVWWSFDRWLRTLLECVKNRALRSARLKNLGFIRCHGINAHIVEPLRQFVDDVVVQGLDE
jgi:hypothetical protein